ncbi:MAG: hypothetical protein AAFQ42_14900 [Pseudomonadota bacterium]
MSISSPSRHPVHYTQARVVRPPRAAQMDFSPSVSRIGTVGFAALSIGLAVLTFGATTGMLVTPTELMAQMRDERAPAPVDVIAPVRVETMLEPKTTARLPIFGKYAPQVAGELERR